MLSSLDALEKGFTEAREKSRKECGKELELLRELVFGLRPVIKGLIPTSSLSPKKINSLVFWNIMNLIHTGAYTLFLASNALYRTAYDNTRHILESILQAFYLDSRHPDVHIDTKIEILKEIEDEPSYHVIRLINKLKIPNKDKIIIPLYHDLSNKIHPTIRTFKSVLELFRSEDDMPTIVDCEEIREIHNNTKTVIDVFLLIYISSFPEDKEPLKNDKLVIDYVKKHQLILASEALGIS